MELKSFNAKYDTGFSMGELAGVIDDAKKVLLSYEMQEFHKRGKIIEFRAKWDTRHRGERNILGLLPDIESKWEDVTGRIGDIIVKSGFPLYVYGWEIEYRVKESKP